MRSRPALAAAVVCLSLLTACGGSSGGDGDQAAGDTSTKAEFIAQGDAICKGLETDGESIAPPADEQDFGRFIREAVTLAKGAREDFAALTPPEDGEQVQQSLLEALDSSLASAEGAATAAEDGDTVSAGDLLDQASQAGDAADQAARDYGFTECGAAEDDANAGGEEQGEALFKEDFLVSGDAICRQLADATQQVAVPADEADFARYLNEVLPLAADAREAFSSLTPPADGAAVQQELLTALDATIDAGAAASIAAEQGDTVTAGDLLNQAAEAGSAADASAQAYGFQQCGNNAS